MQDLTISLVQINQKWESKEENFSKYEVFLNSIDNSHLIVLPEMFHTGFSMNVDHLAEEMNDSLGLSWLREWAAKKNAAFYTSLIIKDGKHFYNRGVFVFPSGEVECYDKRKSFGMADEPLFFTAGKQAKIIEYLGWKINLQICYDLRFPLISLNKIGVDDAPNYDLMIYVANWPEKRSWHWKSLLVSRAIENQSFVIGVNRVGIDEKNLNYSGDSMMCDANGEIIISNNNEEKVLTKTINIESLKQLRARLPFLKDQSSF